MQVLKPHDVITAFEGVPIANDGTVAFREGERMSVSHLVSFFLLPSEQIELKFAHESTHNKVIWCVRVCVCERGR